MTSDKNQPLFLVADDELTQLLLTRQTLENAVYRRIMADSLSWDFDFLTHRLNGKIQGLPDQSTGTGIRI